MKKYYTTFLFEGEPDPKGLHCTHKYFGKLSPDEVGQVMITLKTYFAVDPFQPSRAVFSNPQLFGPRKNVRVLVLSFATCSLLSTLRKLLCDIKRDDYPTVPHVTTPDLLRYEAKIVDYVLVEDGQIIWRAAK
jgi:hypothetical protein